MKTIAYIAVTLALLFSSYGETKAQSIDGVSFRPSLNVTIAAKNRVSATLTIINDNATAKTLYYRADISRYKSNGDNLGWLVQSKSSVTVPANSSITLDILEETRDETGAYGGYYILRIDVDEQSGYMGSTVITERYDL